ncbi:MAG: DNA repair protein RecO [Sneathiella sp.]
MHWIDDGLILSIRKYGENSVILHALTRERGRYAGMVRGGTGKRLRGILQPGNEVGLNWRSRLSDQLGTYSIEAKNSSGTLLFENPLSLAASSAALALLDKVLPEREPHPALYDATVLLMSNLGHDPEVWGPLFVRWELGLLTELGYGLDLSECAATGATDDLVYVSPKSARAVSAEAGLPYRDRMLPLPAFLADGGVSGALEKPLLEQIDEGFKLTGFFIRKNLLPNYGEESLPARERFLNALHRKNGASGSRS